MEYHERLRGLREDADKTQKEVAAFLGATYQYYNKYEMGIRPIPFERIIMLAEYYNVSIDYIAGFTKERKPLKKK